VPRESEPGRAEVEMIPSPGHPGVGKTVAAKSISPARMNRQFVRLSSEDVRDEAENPAATAAPTSARSPRQISRDEEVRHDEQGASCSTKSTRWSMDSCGDP